MIQYFELTAENTRQPNVPEDNIIIIAAHSMDLALSHFRDMKVLSMFQHLSSEIIRCRKVSYILDVPLMDNHYEIITDDKGMVDFPEKNTVIISADSLIEALQLFDKAIAQKHILLKGKPISCRQVGYVIDSTEKKEKA